MSKRYIYKLSFLSVLLVLLLSPVISKSQKVVNPHKRDSLAFAEATNGWWKKSMENHEKRIAWWKTARFGCFMHWGVYSLPGGVWKGDKIYGYAEHLMRIEKIPLRIYKKEVVAKFNPVEFNAERWVRRIKKAGMRYLVITAKHHDGFAMYDSDVSDYNIVDATPFHRDLMKELSAACKKYGIKFGFYYSHAFDWEHPDAPGNDWDYKNPGGDRHLYGGRHWYYHHPELIPKILKYVNEKAIPQIKELITKYRPDILWFDTPHKLPPFENIQILKTIRKIDTTVVINGRLARYKGNNLGDYKNTSDRPVEFHPVEGNWEAIPTTNESYGYNKYDNSHKPASFFIKLLAKASSKGGNLLMNIGPMGNGRIDPRDTTILHGISKWMQKNRESIYGTQATPLPPQAWGTSTRKRNILYLHILNWPKNGKLIVGGLLSEVKKAFLLADPAQKSLKVGKLNKQDIKIHLPVQTPDTINTVVALKVKNPMLTDSARLLSSSITNRLLAFDSKLHGSGLHYGDGKAIRYYLEHWKRIDQWMSWRLRVNKGTRYGMIIKYAANRDNEGSTYAISVAGQRVERQVRYPSQGNKIYKKHITTLMIPKGEHELKIKPVSIKGDELMKLFEIRLVPLDSQNIN